MKTFYHGTSTEHLGAIRNHGLQPPSKTGQTTEKRKDKYDEIFLVADSEEGQKFAKGYAIRAAHKFGGRPIVLKLKIDTAKFPVKIERKGRVDQWSISNLPADCIVEEKEIKEDSTERMVELFKSVSHNKIR